MGNPVEKDNFFTIGFSFLLYQFCYLYLQDVNSILVQHSKKHLQPLIYLDVINMCKSRKHLFSILIYYFYQTKMSIKYGNKFIKTKLNVLNYFRINNLCYFTAK